MKQGGGAEDAVVMYEQIIYIFVNFFVSAGPATFRQLWGNQMGDHLWRKWLLVKENPGKFWMDMDRENRQALLRYLFANNGETGGAE